MLKRTSTPSFFFAKVITPSSQVKDWHTSLHLPLTDIYDGFQGSERNNRKENLYSATPGISIMGPETLLYFSIHNQVMLYPPLFTRNTFKLT